MESDFLDGYGKQSGNPIYLNVLIYWEVGFSASVAEGLERTLICTPVRFT